MSYHIDRLSSGRTLKQLNGQRIGKLVVLSEAPRRIMKGGVPRRYLLCQCDCGTTREFSYANLAAGLSASCGCSRRDSPRKIKIGPIWKTNAYKRWCSMKIRCLRVNHAKYPNYGGRGISICERWLDFPSFFADMGECPDGMSIDRIDNDRGYEPGNCRWATASEQMSNQRRSLRIATDCGYMTPIEYSMKHGISVYTVYGRIKAGRLPVVPARDVLLQKPLPGLDGNGDAEERS